jgi:peptidoglycan/LPS O-acetylase OafA/YrhL
MSASADTQASYFTQLDTLRFLAVMGVIGAHTWHPRRLPWLLGDVDMAGFGVRLFFVLSGFLITGILLRCRESAETTLQSPLFFFFLFASSISAVFCAFFPYITW